MRDCEIKNAFLNNERKDYYFKNKKKVNNLEIIIKKKTS